MRYLNARNTAFGEDRKIYSTVDSTATAGQTVFNVAYDQGRVAVFLNGIRLVPVQDYTYTLSGIGSSITLGAGITANDYLELIGLQGINAGNAVTEDNFVVGTASTGSGGSYTNSTTVFPVSSSVGDLVSVWRNGIKLVPTTDFTVDASASTVTLQSASNTADEITVHVVGILQHSSFVQSTGGTFTGTVAHTGTLDVSGGTLTTSTAQKTAVVDGGKGNLTKSDVGLGNVTNDAQVPASGGTFTGNLDVTKDNPVIRLTDADTALSDDEQSSGIEFYQSDASGAGVGASIKAYGQGSTGLLNLRFATGDNTEAIRIDSSGNVLVGTTSATPHTGTSTGVAIRNDGGVFFTRGNADVLNVNRTTSDGDIARFRKDGTTVGTIGVRGGTSLYIESTASTRTGLDLSGDILPRYGGSLSDNQTDLGASSYRFKDLYLSGGVYLGGTGSANKISDYEEGTFNTSPMYFLSSGSVTMNAQTLRYTKIGSLVTCTGNLHFNTVTSQNGPLKIPLPFASGTSYPKNRAISYVGDYEGGNNVAIKIEANATFGLMVLTQGWSTHTIGNGHTRLLTFSYHTDL